MKLVIFIQGEMQDWPVQLFSSNCLFPVRFATPVADNCCHLILLATTIPVAAAVWAIGAGRR